MSSPENQSAALREDADLETSGEGYAGRFAGPVGEWFLAEQARHTLELLAPWPGARVLDVGGGHGQLTGPLLAAGYSVTVAGSDPACRTRLDRLLPGGGFDFLAGDLRHLPWPDRAFDAVLCFRLLPHAHDWQDLVRELCRLAGRTVIVDYPDRKSVNVIADRMFGLKKAVEKNTRHFTLFRYPEVAGAFQAQGFTRLDKRPQFFWPMALHRALGRRGLAAGLEGLARSLGLTGLWGSPVILRACPE
ncbi:MAG: methyltransferase domain-containing protein [Deltaproteobacteria bacterium]|nr:methyltransferase domain-containing protein [Deltaproteobacteria bacterium]